MLLGWTGLVLSGTTRNPARLVYGSAALVASLRGQQSHFATLPISEPVHHRHDRRRKEALLEERLDLLADP